jgi:hypothetical protein
MSDELHNLFEEEAEAVEEMTDTEKRLLQIKSDAWRKQRMGEASKTVLFEQEATHNRVLDLGKHPKSFANILKEFSQEQFKFGAATLNYQTGDDRGTMHLTVRLWGTDLMKCPVCKRIREVSWAICDEGRALHCYSNCGMVLRPSRVDDQIAIQVASSRNALGKVRM